MKKTILGLLIALLLFAEIQTIPVSAAAIISGNCGESVSYVLDDKGTLTISGTGPMADYATSVAVPWYDHRTAIKSIVIQEGVTSIGDRVFSAGSEVTAVSIPNSVQYIGAYAFYGCSKLTELALPESLKTMGEFAFYYCSKLTDIQIPDGVETIGASAFSDCEALPALNIPASVKTIGKAAFYDCTSLTAVHVDVNNPFYMDEVGIVFNKDKTELVVYPAGRSETKYDIPSGVVTIGDYAFFNCSALKDVTIPAGVSVVGGYAFRQCTALTEIDLPDTVKTIGDSAFYGCIGLTDITFPSGLTSIGTYAFYYDSGLTEITLPDTLSYIGERAFQYCTNLRTIHALCDDLFIDDYAFNACKNITNLRFSGGAPSELDYYAFAGAKITAFFPHDGAGWAEFIPIKRGGTVTWLPYSGAQIIGSGSYGEENALSWTLDENGLLILAGTGEMPDFEPGQAPWNEYSDDIHEVIVAAGITHIGGFSFYGCTEMEEIWFLGNGPTFHESAFAEIDANARFSVEKSKWTASLKKDYGGSVTWVPIGKTKTVLASGTYGEKGQWSLDYQGYLCIEGDEDIPGYTAGKAPWYKYREYITSLSINGKISQIGINVFYRLTKLEKAYLVSDAETMTLAKHVFHSCSALKEISFGSKTFLGPEVFRGCSKLKTIYINDAPGKDALAGFVAESDGFYNLTATVYYPHGLTATDNLGSFGAKKLTWSESYRGTCGIGAEWLFEEATGTLTISGGSGLKNYPSGQSTPWNHFSEKITRVVVDSEITVLPPYFLEGLENALSITLPNSLQTISCSAFNGCGQLNNLMLPTGVKTVADTQFAGCTALTDLYYPGTEAEWGEVENAANICGAGTGGELTVHFLKLHETTATCTEPGLGAHYLFDDTSVYASIYDNHKNIVSEIPAASALGHSYTEKVSDRLAGEATCKTPATYYLQCDRCPEISDTHTAEVGDRGGHLYTDAADAACDHCGLVRDVIYLSAPPAAEAAAYSADLTLGKIRLTGGIVADVNAAPLAGTWAWAAPDTKVYAGVSGHTAVFRPTDTRFPEVRVEVEVTVSPAAQTLSSIHGSPDQICTFYAGPGLEMRDMVSSNMNVSPVFVITEDEGEAYVEGTVLYSPDAGFVTVAAQFPGVDVNGDGTHEYAPGSVEIHTKFTTVPMFRMYDKNGGEHFYTGSEVERDTLMAAGWEYEGVGFNYPAIGAPVYRLYDDEGSGDHLYTMDQAEIDRLVAAGWNNEGVAFNSAADTEVAQYRLYNPNAHPNGTRGAWHFTSDEGERNMLIAAGWQDQGIGWYSTRK